MIVSPLAGRLSNRYGPPRLIAAGLAAMLVGTSWLSATATSNAPALLSIGIALVGSGFGMVNAPLVDIVGRSIGTGEVGPGMGIYQACYYIGAAIGPTLASVFLDWRSRFLRPPVNPVRLATIVPGYSDVFLIGSIVMLLALALVNVLSRKFDSGPGFLSKGEERTGHHSHSLACGHQPPGADASRQRLGHQRNQ